VKRAARRHDVDACSKQPAQVVEVQCIGHVQHTVRREVDDVADAGGGGHPDSCGAAEVASVAARLVMPMDVHAGQVHARVFDDGPQRVRADGSR
jgi:hypothetical protein